MQTMMIPETIFDRALAVARALTHNISFANRLMKALRTQGTREAA